MKTKLYKLSSVILVLALVFSMRLTVYAHHVPDMDRLGSITITTYKGNTIVKGGSLTLYRVGEVVNNSGKYSFQPTGDFVSCGEAFDNLDAAADVAARLKDVADIGSFPGLDTKEIGTDGSVRFDNLTIGLYLMVQYKAAPGYAKLAPFLVSLPYLEDGVYKYDLTALPKTALEQEEEPMNPPATEPSPEPSPEPSLPQTGQLWWPVPILAVMGMAFFAMGWWLFANREKKYEG